MCQIFSNKKGIKSDSCSVKDLERLNFLMTFLDCAKSSCSLSMSPYCIARNLCSNTNHNSLIITSKFNYEALSRNLLTSTVFNILEYGVGLAG